jgi:hypothetical protein
MVINKVGKTEDQWNIEIPCREGVHKLTPLWNFRDKTVS